MTPRDAIGRARDAFLWACRLDVEARKPGNVSAASPGHGMQAQQFVDSAQAAQHALFEAGAPVGRRIEGAVAASVHAAGCNTNLGIVLLCAPIAAAVEREPQARTPAALRAAIAQVLRGLDVDDARAAYRAIACANPGGLGRAPAQDVAQAPEVTLREAMALAAHRDSIARQYVTDHAELFDIGVPAFAAARPSVGAMQHAWLGFLAHRPDSHIVRKHGPAAAHSVLRDARRWLARVERAEPGERLDDDDAYARWDARLKGAGLNPGTTADLAVASAMLAALLAERDVARNVYFANGARNSALTFNRNSTHDGDPSHGKDRPHACR